MVIGRNGYVMVGHDAVVARELEVRLNVFHVTACTYSQLYQYVCIIISSIGKVCAGDQSEYLQCQHCASQQMNSDGRNT